MWPSPNRSVARPRMPNLVRGPVCGRPASTTRSPRSLPEPLGRGETQSDRAGTKPRADLRRIPGPAAGGGRGTPRLPSLGVRVPATPGHASAAPLSFRLRAPGGSAGGRRRSSSVEQPVRAEVRHNSTRSISVDPQHRHRSATPLPCLPCRSCRFSKALFDLSPSIWCTVSCDARGRPMARAMT